MEKVKAFRGLIYSRFDNEAEFARALHWPRQRVNKYSNGQQQPGLKEIDEMARLLMVDPGELMQIFLQHWSPFGDDNQPRAG